MVKVPRPPRWWTASVTGIVLAGAVTVGTVRAARENSVIYTVPGPAVTNQAHPSPRVVTVTATPPASHGPLPPRLRVYAPDTRSYYRPVRPVVYPPRLAYPVRRPVPVRPYPVRTRHVQVRRPAPAVTVTVTGPPPPPVTYVQPPPDTPPPDTQPTPADTPADTYPQEQQPAVTGTQAAPEPVPVPQDTASPGPYDPGTGPVPDPGSGDGGPGTSW